MTAPPWAAMPQSATATGLIDAVMPVEDMPAKLLDYQSHLLKVASKKDGDGTALRRGRAPGQDHFPLRGRVGHDFSKYKANSIEARRRAEKSLKHAAHTLDRQPKWRFSVAAVHCRRVRCDHQDRNPRGSGLKSKMPPISGRHFASENVATCYM